MFLNSEGLECVWKHVDPFNPERTAQPIVVCRFELFTAAQAAKQLSQDISFKRGHTTKDLQCRLELSTAAQAAEQLSQDPQVGTNNPLDLGLRFRLVG